MRPVKLSNFLISTSMLALATNLTVSASAEEIVIDNPTEVAVDLDGGDNLTITPEGSIIPVAGANGVQSTGSNDVITNGGLIETSGGGDAIRHVGDNVVIKNTGAIRTFGTAGRGIRSEGFGAIIENWGTIVTVGDDSHGIRSTGQKARITNSGYIRTSGNGAHGIRVAGKNTTVENSGLLIAESPGSNAFYFVNQDDIALEDATLNLKAPGYIGGAISFAAVSTVSDPETITVNLTTGPSHSVLWDLSNGDMFGGDPASISGPVPWFYNSTTKQFATFDPSGLAGTVNQLGDITNLLSMVGRNGPGSGDGNGGSGEDITSNAWATTSPAADGLGYLWTAGFGSTMDHDGDLTTLDQETSLTGAAAGYRWQQAADLKFNVMAGYIQGEIKADSPYVRSQNIETDGWFAGVYGQQDLNGFTIDFGIVSGWLSSDSTRFVNDNLALTNGLTLGQSLALASYNSWFIAPEFGVAMDFDMEGVVYTPSARVRYSMQEIDGYAETGSNSNADVGARSIGVFEANVEMAATKRVNFGSLTGRAGYMFRNSNGDDAASISMLGITQSVGFGDSDASAAYLGVEADIEITPDMKLVIGGQGFFGEEVQGYQGMTRFVASF